MHYEKIIRQFDGEIAPINTPGNAFELFADTTKRYCNTEQALYAVLPFPGDISELNRLTILSDYNPDYLKKYSIADDTLTQMCYEQPNERFRFWESGDDTIQKIEAGIYPNSYATGLILDEKFGYMTGVTIPLDYGPPFCVAGAGFLLPMNHNDYGSYQRNQLKLLQALAVRFHCHIKRTVCFTDHFGITPATLVILQMLAQGWSYQKISNNIAYFPRGTFKKGIAAGGIRYHVNEAIERLQCSNRDHLLAIAAAFNITTSSADAPYPALLNEDRKVLHLLLTGSTQQQVSLARLSSERTVTYQIARLRKQYRTRNTRHTIAVAANDTYRNTVNL